MSDLQRAEYHHIIRTHLSSAYLLSDEKIDSVLPGFLETLQNLIETLDQVASQKSPEAVSRAGHALKGALLNLGLQELAECAFIIEKNCKFSEIEWNYQQLVAELKQEIAKIV